VRAVRWRPMDLELFVTPGLGDASYLLASGRDAVLVDPQRDAWRFLEVAERRGWRIRHVLETHVHNDYISGALETHAATGAEIAAPARGRYEFEHRAMDEGDAIELGGLVLTAMATPGHTPDLAGRGGPGRDRPARARRAGCGLHWRQPDRGLGGANGPAWPGPDGCPHARSTAQPAAPLGAAGRGRDPADARRRQLLQRRACRLSPRLHHRRGGLRTRASRSRAARRTHSGRRRWAGWAGIPRTTRTWPG
jgi:hypothetical protein